MKKPLSISLAILLLLSIATVMVPVSVSADTHDAQAIWVDPGSYLTAPDLDTLKTSDTFTVDVKINITDPDPTQSPPDGLFGFSYELKWDKSNLELESYTPHAPPTWGKYFVPDDTVADYNTTHKYHSLGISALADPTTSPFTGVCSLCTYNFHVIETIFMPDPDEIGNLLLQQTKLAHDKEAGAIAHTAYSGQYRKCAQPIPTPEIRVVPRKTTGVCGQKFNISIAIYNLAKQWNLWGWEANLTYNTVHLDGMNSFEGPFLPSFQGPNGTYYINMIDDTGGSVLTAGGFLGNHTAPESIGTEGVVAIIEFNASFQTTAPDIQASDFILTGTKLVGQYPNGTLFNIPHTLRDGKYNVPYKIVGWALDCYTDVFRKKCEAAYTGKGINQTADPYEPQDLVILYAYLEYNFEPEAYKLISFEVHGPPNAVQNITIYRTAYTNASGVATINFTIPGSGLPNWQEMVMGHWECLQKAQVKIYKTPSDWLYWKVGWIIEIINVTVKPGPGGWAGQDGPKKCEWIEIDIEFKTIAFIPKNVCFTITVLDELLDPIQWEFFWVLNVEPTEYYLCSFRIDYTNTTSHIPMWAHVGKATVYVNAFTDLPRNCGCPYCPEFTAEVWIIATADP